MAFDRHTNYNKGLLTYLGCNFRGGDRVCRPRYVFALIAVLFIMFVCFELLFYRVRHVQTNKFTYLFSSQPIP